MTIPIQRNIPIALVVMVVSASIVIGMRMGPCWWSGDDPQILKHAVSHQVWELFGRPSAWRELSVSNWTPWVSLSYLMDWWAGGFSPAVFYVHQAVSICVLCSLVAAVSVRWLGTWGGTSATVAFTSSLPIVEAGCRLMVRHYVEGAVWALLSFLFYREGVRRSRWGFYALSWIFYVLSCFAKEIFFPLPVLFLGVEGTRILSGAFLCHVAWSCTYLVWRGWMLGSFGGYGPSGFAQVGALVNSIIRHSGWSAYGIWLVPVGAGLVALRSAPLKKRCLAMAVFMMVVLPLAAVGVHAAPRHMLLPSLWLALSFGWAVGRVHAFTRFGSAVVAAAVLSVLIVTNQWQWRAQMVRVLDRAATEGILVLEGAGKGWLQDPVEVPWFYDGLGWFRVRVLEKEPGIVPFWDPLALKTRGCEPIYRFLETQRSLEVVDDSCTAWRKFEPRLRTDAAMDVEIRYQAPFIRWTLGPYKEGQYAVILDGYCRLYHPVASRDEARVYLSRPRMLQVCYTSPEGWMTYSPLFFLVPRDGVAQIRWKR